MMRSTIRWLLATILAATALVVSISASAAGYVRFEGIKGESTTQAPDHKGWIDILSVSWTAREGRGKSHSAPVRAGGTGGPGQLVIVMRLDAATPRLQEAVCKGGHFETVTIDMPASGSYGGKPQAYLRYELGQVTSSCSAPAATGADRPVQSVTLDYGRIRAERLTPKPVIQGVQTAK